MLPNIGEERRRGNLDRRRARVRNRGLKLTLWAIWTLVVAATAYRSYHADVLAQRPVDLIGMVVHCVVVGLIGLIVLTVIEQRLEPWRFLD